MKNYNKSLRRIKQQKNKEICAKMRASKERKRVENASPPVARLPNKHAMTFFVKDHRTGQTVNLECYEGSTLRSYWVYEPGKGWWNEQAGKARIYEVLKQRFPNVGRFD